MMVVFQSIAGAVTDASPKTWPAIVFYSVICKNHDQIGNRAKGDRTSRLMRTGKLKIGSALAFTSSPFVPMLFQGEEWGASNAILLFHGLWGSTTGEGCARGALPGITAVFGWRPEDTSDPQAPETFEHSKIRLVGTVKSVAYRVVRSGTEG